MEYTITPQTRHTSAEVRGIDLNEGVDGEPRATLTVPLLSNTCW